MDDRTGALAGIAAYSLWGVFPLVFARLDTVPAGEVLLHRIVWSFVVVMVLLALRAEDRRVARGIAGRPGTRLRLAAAGGVVAVNWLVYIGAVESGNVVEAALGYYINPLLTVGLGVVVLGERLARLQVVALGFGAASVAVLTIAYGRVPWIALTLAVSFAAYSYLKKAAPVGAVPSLAAETTALVPFATLALVALAARGDLEFAHGPVGRDALLVGLGVITVVPLLLFAAAARRIPLSLLGLLQYLTPTFQLVCGVALLGEALPPERLAGFALVWVALALLATDAVRDARRDVPAAEPV